MDKEVGKRQEVPDKEWKEQLTLESKLTKILEKLKEKKPLLPKSEQVNLG